MSDYAKGEKPRDMDAAKGGLVLDRLRSFAKDPDDYHPLGTGLNGPENEQSYTKGGGAKNVSKREGNKSLPMESVKYRSDESAL